MKNLPLHKYFTMNIFIFVNAVNFFNFTLFIFLNIIKYQWMLFFLDSVFLTWLTISVMGIPLSGISVIIEFLLRRYNIIRKNSYEIINTHQIYAVYFVTIVLTIMYLIFIIICLLPPSPEEIKAIMFD